MNEQIHEIGDSVLAHQQQDGNHRLVLCSRPRQFAGEWVPLSQVAITVDGWMIRNGESPKICNHITVFDVVFKCAVCGCIYNI